MKPPKNLTSGNDADGHKTAGKGFGEDSFRNYMARKIELQRNQFGLVLPPDPREKSAREAKTEDDVQANQRKQRRVQFSKRVQIQEFECDNFPLKKAKKTESEDSGPLTVLEKLQQKYQKDDGVNGDRREASESPIKKRKQKRLRKHSGVEEVGTPGILKNLDVVEKNRSKAEHTEKDFKECDVQSVGEEFGDDERAVKGPPSDVSHSGKRPDLFFLGVVVLVNGYTNPDAGAIQRMIHRHGGDLEKYETGRVTHIIAEHLSTAKANIYKRQRKPTPVVKPSWIVESVKAYRLLPFADFLLDEVRDETARGKTVKSFFSQKAAENHPSDLTTRDQGKRNTTLLENKFGCEADGGNNESGVDGIECLNEACCPPARSGDVTVDAVCESLLPSNTETTNATNSPIKTSNPNSARVRTVGTDPDFLESYFKTSRLSFIGSFKQRSKTSPTKKRDSISESGSSSHRLVFHVDMDCFFASVVLRNYPDEYRKKPVAISHTNNISHNGSKRSTSECATCNYEARKYGIRKGMFLGRARELCPDLVVLQYDFNGYEEVSEQVEDILHRFAEQYNGSVEQVSCDESYMELLIPTNGKELRVEPLVLAEDIAKSIRQDIVTTTQCTASVGVGQNKLLAKLATDSVKPDNFRVVRNFRDILEPLRLRELPGIGYRKEKELKVNGLVSVQDVWDLGERADSELKRILGNATGEKMAEFCKGVDHRPIQPAERKSIGAECNYGVRFDGPYGVEYMMSGLAKEVEKRMGRVGVRGRRITLKVKQRKEGAKNPPKFLGHGSCHNHSKSTDIPLTRAWQDIAGAGMELFGELKIPEADIRGMGVVVTKLDNKPSSATVPRSSVGGIASFLIQDEQLRPKDVAATPPRTTERPPMLQQRVRDTALTEMNLDAEESSTTEGTLSKAESSRSGHVEGSETNEQGNQSEDDIELPPLNQIHMSQVMALPDDLRSHIMIKMQATPPRNDVVDLTEIEESDCVIPRDDTSTLATGSRKRKRSPNSKSGGNSPGSLDTSLRYRQVDLKRMMKLAAVKNGEEILEVSTGESVSLTQLNSLPLEVQLQVANNDDYNVGALSPMSSRQRTRKRVEASPEKTVPKLAHIETFNDNSEKVDERGKEDEDSGGEMESASFYEEQLLPLHRWMDVHCNPNMDDVNHVKNFLTIVVSEDRIVDAIQMLKSIRSRNDYWSSRRIYSDQLLRTVVEKYREVPFGGLLDTKWLKLS